MTAWLSSARATRTPQLIQSRPYVRQIAMASDFVERRQGPDLAEFGSQLIRFICDSPFVFSPRREHHELSISELILALSAV